MSGSKMARSKDYQRMLNNKRWVQLRASYLQKHPLCELCLAEGYTKAAVDVHHKTPVESFSTLAEMETACYSWENLQALCIPCHVKIHKEMGRATKENHIKRQSDRLARWIEKHRQRQTGTGSEVADLPDSSTLNKG